MDLKRGVDFIGITVPFVVHDGTQRFLLQKRSKNCRDEQGTWDVGGGALEFGEEWEAGVRREVREEIGVEAEEVVFLGSFNLLREHNNIPTHWLALVYAVKVEPEDVRINEPDKIDEIGWFTLDELPSPLHSKMMLSLEAAREVNII